MGWITDTINSVNPINIGVNQLEAAQQYSRQKKLMDIQNSNQQAMMDKQMQNQMKLNTQGQEIQLDTWEKTNYPAQMEMLKKAGLNAGLMYAKGGTSGTTGGQGGGSAASGSAASGTATMSRGVNMMNVMEIRNMQAQKDLIDAQRKKVEAETPGTGGLIAAETEAKKAGAAASLASANESNARAEGQKIANAYSPQERITLINKNLEETRKTALENKWTEEQWNNNRTILTQSIIRGDLENQLTREKIELTATETEGISVRLAQELEKIMQTNRQLDQKDVEIALNTAKYNLEKEYPGVQDVIGSVLKKAYGNLEMIANAKLWSWPGYGNNK
ncbi:MAG: DNA pilot protein [Microviridae sp.]|nr:MAG: DNA pilot protein [Microviridae sp.]